MNDAGLSQEVSAVCPICGCTETVTAYPHAADYITRNIFSVLSCTRCFISWTNPVPDDLDPYYPRSYRRYNKVIISILKFLYRRRVARWNKLFSQPGNALEFGCGDGFMLDSLRSYGWDVCGTERTEEMASFARKHFGLQVYIENSQPIPPERRFQLVVMFQVLEHLSDPLDQLKRAATLLAEGGCLIVGVPNFRSWQNRYGKEGWFHLDVPRHLFHWSPDSLAVAAAHAGLQIDSVNFVSFEHDPYGWIQTILNRHCGNQNRLTRLLMRAEPWSIADLGTLLIAALLTPAALMLSISSWICGRGAIMQAVLRKQEKPKT